MIEKRRTLFDKIWDSHVVEQRDDGTCLVFIDRHLVHEVTSPQAFEALRSKGRGVRRPELTLAVPDHNLPTTPRLDRQGNSVPIADPASALQIAELERNAISFDLRYFAPTAREQGIVHVVGPEQGFSLPGATIVCGDSHTACHGGLGAWGFGIGTSEVEQVLAVQALLLRKPWNMEVQVVGQLKPHVTAKDLILHIIGVIGTAGGMGHVIEFRGQLFKDMSIESRLTVCNMSIEAGARGGLIAPDDVTFAYLKGRPLAPRGEDWDNAIAYWQMLHSDDGAHFDRSVIIEGDAVEPTVTWGTSPADVVSIDGIVPHPMGFQDASRRRAAQASLDYMGLKPGTRIRDIEVQNIFIGSCTNSRIEDLRSAAEVLKGNRIHPNIRLGIVVPGSGLVKLQAESEGLDRIFIEAGLEWREPGCSACLGMNPDKVPAGERCASTSNRNFVGRQGPGARTHLVSPATAAASAIAGRLASPTSRGPILGTSTWRKCETKGG